MDVEVLKQKILDLAIRGKLVPQDPNDEPASVLIEKIKAEKSKLVKEGKIKATKEESYIYKGSDNCYYEKIGNKVFDITDEIPFDIPTNWTFSRLDNYVKLVTDFVASGSFASLRENVKYYDEPNYAVLVRTCDFKSNFKDSLVYTDKHGYDFLSNSNLYGGEILLSNIGASIGKVFIVPYLNVRMTLAPNSIMVKLTNDELREYFYYLFLSPYGQKILNEISASSAQAKFNKTDFKKLIIPIPPLKEQKRINNILSKVNEHIENIYNEYNQIEELIKIAKSKILDEVFGDNSSYKSYYEKEYTLDELLPYEQPGPYIVNSTDYNDSYKTPVITPGKSFILGYTNENNGIYSVGDGKVIIFDDFTTASRLINFDFKVKSSAMKILRSSNPAIFNIDYLYYLLQTLYVNNDTHKRYWISEYAPLKVKIHTYDEQLKIIDFIKSTYKILESINRI